MRILVTTDGSERSLDALSAAHAFARQADASITLVRILNPRIDAADEFAPSLAQAVGWLRERWETDLASALDRAGVSGDILVVEKNRAESTARAILRAATQVDAGMIAMATRGSGRIRRAIMGSVALEVLGRTALPVLVTGRRFQPAQRATTDRYRVVITTDGSPGSLAAMRELAHELSSGGVDLALLRICWPGDVAESQEPLEAIAASLPGERRPAVIVHELAMIDGATKAIISVTGELEASVIAMATQGYRGAYHVFAGSIALAVVERSTLPVILARSKG